jgi:hypothetical protein
MVETVMTIIFLGAGWIPFVGAVSLIGLLIFTVIAVMIQLRKPLERRSSKGFFKVLRYQFLFFLVTHTLFSLLMIDFHEWQVQAIDVWMRFLSVALVGLTVEIPLCLIGALIVLAICRGCSLVQLLYGFLVTIIGTAIIGWISFNIASMSLEKGWLRVRPVDPIVVP